MSQQLNVNYTCEDDDGEEVEIAFSVPAKYEVCGCCGGSGSCVDERIDRQGFTASEWADCDPDFREDYMAGRFDGDCPECHGLRVVKVVAVDRLTPAQVVLVDAWHEWLDGEAYYAADSAAERAAERSMGC